MAVAATPSAEQVPLAPGTWKVDPSHTTLGFAARHLMVTKVRGTVSGVFGRHHGGCHPGGRRHTPRSKLRAWIPGDPNETPTSADFFDVQKYPTLEFQSRIVTPRGDSRWDVQGDLTIRGVTKPVTLDVQFHGVISKDPWGGQRAGFSATATVAREDFGLLWNRALENGGVVLGKDIRLELEVEAIRS